MASVDLAERSPLAGWLRGSLSFLRRKVPLSVAFGFLWLAAMIVIALFAGYLRPYDITAMDLTSRLSAPGTLKHWLGTDELGRDVLSRLIQSIRVSLIIAFGATLLSAVFGTALGFAAARFRGMTEHLVLALADFQAALPFLIMSLAVLAFFGSSMVLLVCLMGFYGWERYARIARGLAISAGAQGYAAAVVQLGATPARVAARG